MNKELLLELSTSVLGLRPESFPLLYSQIKEGDRVMHQVSVSLSDNMHYCWRESHLRELPSDSIVVVPIEGVMFKYYGVDDAADIIRAADDNPNIAGIILQFNTPGGSTQSLIQIEDALRGRRKPCSAYIDGMCCSCGIYVASFCDKIYAANPMCEVGSIGAYISLCNMEKLYENLGVKIIDVYPPESSKKNLPYRQALTGDTDLLVKEVLSPFAQHFQEIIKTNRPSIDLECDGILEGRIYFAKDAINNGLIDGLKNLKEVADEVRCNAINYKSIITLKS